MNSQVISKRARWAVLLAVASVAAACDRGDDDPKELPPEGTFIELQSDPGDWIGGGATYRYTQADAIIAVEATGGYLSVIVTGDESWWGDFQAPSALARLEQGSYANLTRYPFHDPAVGGLSWSGEGRGCNTLTGSFTVQSVAYAQAGDLLAIDLSFEQHCEGGGPALRGRVHWTSDDTTRPPGPENPPPAGLWAPAPGATPASGDFVYLVSDPGDYIGAGQTYSYAPPSATIAVTASGGHLTVQVSGWYGDFQAMSGLPQIEPGYYGNLQRYPFHNPARGGLSWWGQGRGCNTLTGWFAVDAVTYSAGVLTSIDLRFEQHCEGVAPALRGQVRWGT